MRTKLLISTIAAASMFGTAAMAQTTIGGGVTASTPRGSIAGGATAGRAGKMQQQDRHHGNRPDHMRRGMRQAQGNSASTYGSGTIYTDRHHATGGVTAGASASGTDDQNAASSVDAYGETTRQGSNGEVYGDSNAGSTTPQK